tara:strand:- start:1886 stop:2239 length:354 start_codon:yes stop_codon:yes gene_type:complete
MNNDNPILSFIPSDTLTSETTMNISKSNFTLSPATQDKIQGLSIQLGEVYAQLYRDNDCPTDVVEAALDSYRACRRMLPTVDNYRGEERHEGHSEAYEATNGDTLNSSSARRRIAGA